MPPLKDQLEKLKAKGKELGEVRDDRGFAKKDAAKAALDAKRADALLGAVNLALTAKNARDVAVASEEATKLHEGLQDYEGKFLSMPLSKQLEAIANMEEQKNAFLERADQAFTARGISGNIKRKMLENARVGVSRKFADLANFGFKLQAKERQNKINQGLNKAANVIQSGNYGVEYGALEAQAFRLFKDNSGGAVPSAQEYADIKGTLGEARLAGALADDNYAVVRELLKTDDIKNYVDSRVYNKFVRAANSVTPETASIKKSERAMVVLIDQGNFAAAMKVAGGMPAGRQRDAYLKLFKKIQSGALNKDGRIHPDIANQVLKGVNPALYPSTYKNIAALSRKVLKVAQKDLVGLVKQNSPANTKYTVDNFKGQYLSERDGLDKGFAIVEAARKGQPPGAIPFKDLNDIPVAPEKHSIYVSESLERYGNHLIERGEEAKGLLIKGLGASYTASPLIGKFDAMEKAAVAMSNTSGWASVVRNVTFDSDIAASVDNPDVVKHVAAAAIFNEFYGSSPEKAEADLARPGARVGNKRTNDIKDRIKKMLKGLEKVKAKEVKFWRDPDFKNTTGEDFLINMDRVNAAGGTDGPDIVRANVRAMHIDVIRNKPELFDKTTQDFLKRPGATVVAGEVGFHGNFEVNLKDEDTGNIIPLTTRYNEIFIFNPLEQVSFGFGRPFKEIEEFMKND